MKFMYFSIKNSAIAILYWKNINFIYNRLFCCNHTYCVGIVSVTSASHYVTSASHYQSRSSMFIRGWIPRNWPRQFRLVIWSISRWLLWQPPWILEQNHFSNTKSPGSPPSFSLQCMFREMMIKEFQDDCCGWHLGYWIQIILAILCELIHRYSKTCLKWTLTKRQKNGFQDQLSLNAGQKYCRMLQESNLQYFWPSLSFHLSLRSLFYLFLSGRFTQVSLNSKNWKLETQIVFLPANSYSIWGTFYSERNYYRIK